MRRILGFLILFAVLGLLLRHVVRLAFQAMRPESGPRPGAGRSRRSPRSRHGELVRDKVCNTFLPKEKALRRDSPGGILYFCSEECLERYKSGADRLTGGKDASPIASTSSS